VITAKFLRDWIYLAHLKSMIKRYEMIIESIEMSKNEAHKISLETYGESYI
jgi:hypothetical protein